MNADTLIESCLPLQFKRFIAVLDRINGRY
jgi:hypothetical protein